MAIKLNPSNFFHYFMFKPQSKKLDAADKRMATFLTIILALPLGLVHLVCRIFVYDKSFFKKQPEHPTTKTHDVAQEVLPKKIENENPLNSKDLSLSGEWDKISTDEYRNRLKNSSQADLKKVLGKLEEKKHIEEVVSYLEPVTISSLPIELFKKIPFELIRTSFYRAIFVNGNLSSEKVDSLNEADMNKVFESLTLEDRKIAPLRLFQKLKFDDFDPKEYPALFGRSHYDPENKKRLEALSDDQLQKVFSSLDVDDTKYWPNEIFQRIPFKLIKLNDYEKFFSFNFERLKALSDDDLRTVFAKIGSTSNWPLDLWQRIPFEDVKPETYDREYGGSQARLNTLNPGQLLQVFPYLKPNNIRYLPVALFEKLDLTKLPPDQNPDLFAPAVEWLKTRDAADLNRLFPLFKPDYTRFWPLDLWQKIDIKQNSPEKNPERFDSALVWLNALNSADLNRFFPKFTPAQVKKWPSELFAKIEAKQIDPEMYAEFLAKSPSSFSDEQLNQLFNRFPTHEVKKWPIEQFKRVRFENINPEKYTAIFKGANDKLNALTDPQFNSVVLSFQGDNIRDLPKSLIQKLDVSKIPDELFNEIFFVEYSRAIYNKLTTDQFAQILSRVDEYQIERLPQNFIDSIPFEKIDANKYIHFFALEPNTRSSQEHNQAVLKRLNGLKSDDLLKIYQKLGIEQLLLWPKELFAKIPFDQILSADYVKLFGGKGNAVKERIRHLSEDNRKIIFDALPDSEIGSFLLKNIPFEQIPTQRYDGIYANRLENLSGDQLNKVYPYLKKPPIDLESILKLDFNVIPEKLYGDIFKGLSSKFISTNSYDDYQFKQKQRVRDLLKAIPEDKAEAVIPYIQSIPKREWPDNLFKFLRFKDLNPNEYSVYNSAERLAGLSDQEWEMLLPHSSQYQLLLLARERFQKLDFSKLTAEQQPLQKFKDYLNLTDEQKEVVPYLTAKQIRAGKQYFDPSVRSLLSPGQIDAYDEV